MAARLKNDFREEMATERCLSGREHPQ
jgi:hypothetical protein